MIVRNAGEALYIACEMEKRAIRLYERALAVFSDGPCQQAVRAILADERNHLNQFAQMGAESPDFERAQLLSAQAARVLFSGGLTEAHRKGAFDSVPALYAFAAEEEREAIARYGEFAAQLTGPAAAAFTAIQLEEKQHLLHLNELIAQAKEE
ncbi:MAG: hypothetical protein IJ662_13435 [Clostridia bacterium]|nr:hypothetical protein [Clostridia bacterium]